MFSNHKVEYGELDKENQKANINISLVPKTIANDMAVKVTVGSETVQMQKNGNEFSADILVGLFEEYNTFPLITITSNGETKTEYLEEHSLSYIWTNYLPTMRGGRIRSHKASWSGNALTVDGEFEIGFNLAELNKDIRFTKYNLITELNGKEISNEDITKTVLAGIVDDANFGGDFTMNFNKTYKMSEKDTLVLFLVAEDSLGYLHKSCAFSWTHPDADGASTEPAHAVQEVYAGEIILDKDGKVLFGKGL